MCFKYTSAKKKLILRLNVYLEVHKGAWDCMKNMLCPGTTCSDLQDSPFCGISVDPLDILQLSRVPPAAKAIVNCRLVAILCLLVEYVLIFCTFRFSSILFKRPFQAYLHHRAFSVLPFCCWWAHIKLPWVTFHSYTAHLGMSSQASTAFILSGASTCTVA